MGLAVLLVVIGGVASAPEWWWHAAVTVTSLLGWRWLPVVVVAVGLWWGGQELIGLQRGSRVRRSPVAERIPLSAHVAALLVVSGAVAVTFGLIMWVSLGRPQLTSAAGTAGWTVQNSFDAVKIVLAVVAGIGGVVALTVAYRKQDHGEAAEHRENTKLFTERFGKAADQLGSAQAAVRLAGAYAMAGLADDWPQGRQSCIDVLCAYLRLPYPQSPDTDEAADQTAPDGGAQRAGLDIDPHEQHVRHTILFVIRDHLLPADDDASDQPRWHGQTFYLRGATFVGGSLAGIHIFEGTTLNLSDTTFSGGRVDFSFARFSGGEVNFSGARFSGGTVDFTGVVFSPRAVEHIDAVSFSRAVFCGGEVIFNAEFAGWVHFADAVFSSGTVNFGNARFTGGSVLFLDAEFSGGTVDFSFAVFSGAEISFAGGFCGSTVIFRRAEFSGGEVRFLGASFSGGLVDFSAPLAWAAPPLDITGSEPGVQWPSAKDLAMARS
jgi:uncharacterized protein YjbI with pentapeptide repeats